ncbi:hypothetical protein IW262DRAFT_504464 [Armillaria fumosa]|nr:hypothetical protein IW262DRAFT_504464 [Armillaria fumosa]
MPKSLACCWERWHGPVPPRSRALIPVRFRVSVAISATITTASSFPLSDLAIRFHCLAPKAPSQARYSITCGLSALRDSFLMFGWAPYSLATDAEHDRCNLMCGNGGMLGSFVGRSTHAIELMIHVKQDVEAVHFVYRRASNETKPTEIIINFRKPSLGIDQSFRATHYIIPPSQL